MHKEIEETINTWNIHIIPKKEIIEKLISSLSQVEDDKTKIELLFKISKEYKILSAISESKKNMVEHLIKFYNQNENQTTLDLNKEYNRLFGNFNV